MSETTAIVLATGLGPLAAVLITLWHQDRKEKRSAKWGLFANLMAYRKSIPISLDWVRALNMIDVVFIDHPKVIKAWHDLFDYLHIRPLDDRQVDHKRLALLSEMAKVLGFRSLQQIDIDRFYTPEAHAIDSVRGYELSTELLRVLKGTERLSAVPRPDQRAA